MGACGRPIRTWEGRVLPVVARRNGRVGEGKPTSVFITHHSFIITISSHWDASRSPEAAVFVLSRHAPSRAVNDSSIGRLLALETLKQAEQDGADFGHVSVECAQGGVFTQAELEHCAEVVRYPE